MKTKPKTIAYVLFFAALFSLILFLQFSFKTLSQDDYYHIRYSKMLMDDGIQKHFPWMKFTVLSDCHYDMYFFYHMLLAPFARGNMIVMAKIAASINAFIMVLSLFFIMKKLSIPYAPLLSTLVLFATPAMTTRMLTLRPLALSVAMLVAGIYLLLGKKYKAIFPLSWFLVLFYSGFPVFVAMVGIYCAAITVHEKKIIFVPLLLCLAGVAAGLILNPYFPNDLKILFLQILKVPSSGAGVEPNAEWMAPSPVQFLLNTWPAIVILAAGIITYISRKKRPGSVEIFFLMLTGFYLVITLRHIRGMDYFMPLAILTGSYMIARSGIISHKYFYHIVITVFVIIIGFTSREVRGSLKKLDVIDNSGSARWLESNTPEGTVVFLCNYGSFPQMFFYNTHNYYTHGLDPGYMREHDPVLYERYLDVVMVDRDPYPILSEIFNTSYIHIENIPRLRPLYNHLRANPGLYRMMYRDNFSAVFMTASESR